MDSTNILEKNYVIQPELLDELEDMYLKQSGEYFDFMKNLMSHPSDTIKHELAVTYGMGLMLKTILQSIPQEIRNERTTWRTTFGPKPGRYRSGSSREKTAGHSVGTEPGGKSFIS